MFGGGVFFGGGFIGDCAFWEVCMYVCMYRRFFFVFGKGVWDCMGIVLCCVVLYCIVLYRRRVVYIIA